MGSWDDGLAAVWCPAHRRAEPKPGCCPYLPPRRTPAAPVPPTGILRTPAATRQGRKVPRRPYRTAGTEPSDDGPVIGLAVAGLAALIARAVSEHLARKRKG